MFRTTVIFAVLLGAGMAATCPKVQQYTSGPKVGCEKASDPLNKPKSAIEEWFTNETFSDLFPEANLGFGGDPCFPYSFEAFVIAARYFPRFGNDSGNGYTAADNARRDVAAFFSHAVQETGANDISLYDSLKTESEADDCFYRGGFFNWFEGGPISSFLPANQSGSQPGDGNQCVAAGRYCTESAEISAFYACGNATVGDYFRSCYFGRGAIQISYNYNYGQFQDWLAGQGIQVDLLSEPNLVMTKMDPPLAVLASLWFYMTPQPPKPAMHDIVVGNWKAGAANEAANYSGPIFGPTSLIINNECNGLSASAPGGGGENRRIRAFIWFCAYFNVQPGANNSLSCKDMVERFGQANINLSYQPDWSSTWKADQACQCAPASYGGLIPYFDADHFPAEFVQLNAQNKARCEKMLYSAPSAFGLDETSAPCLKVQPDEV